MTPNDYIYISTSDAISNLSKESDLNGTLIGVISVLGSIAFILVVLAAITYKGEFSIGEIVGIGFALTLVMVIIVINVVLFSSNTADNKKEIQKFTAVQKSVPEPEADVKKVCEASNLKDATVKIMVDDDAARSRFVIENTK